MRAVLTDEILCIRMSSEFMPAHPLPARKALATGGAEVGLFPGVLTPLMHLQVVSMLVRLRTVFTAKTPHFIVGDVQVLVQ